MSEKIFKPMLSGKVDDFSKLRFPMLASPKLDGIRCLAMDGVPRSRSMKVIPNRFIQAWFKEHADALEGLDGELIVGDPTSSTCYNTTVSAVMREDGEPDFRFYVFDAWNMDLGYSIRIDSIHDRISRTCSTRVLLVRHKALGDMAGLDDYESRKLSEGYEGIMLRSISGPYKQGRSSFKEGYLLKVKRFDDMEAEIIGVEERMHNGNVAFTNELGRTARSSHQENQVPTGTLGAFVVKGLTAFEGITFNVGTGLDDAQRAAAWAIKDTLIGKVIKVKYFSIGTKDAPRHPVFLGYRDLIDLSEAD